MPGKAHTISPQTIELSLTKIAKNVLDYVSLNRAKNKGRFSKKLYRRLYMCQIKQRLFLSIKLTTQLLNIILKGRTKNVDALSIVYDELI
jgi:hypothetical protein